MTLDSIKQLIRNIMKQLYILLLCIISYCHGSASTSQEKEKKYAMVPIYNTCTDIEQRVVGSLDLQSKVKSHSHDKKCKSPIGLFGLAVEMNRKFNEQLYKLLAEFPLPTTTNSFMVSSQSRSYFNTEAINLQRRIGNILHPVLHGCAEDKDGGICAKIGESFKILGSSIKDFFSGNFNSAYNKLKGDKGLWESLKNTTAAIVGATFGAGVERVLFNTGFYGSSGTSESNGHKSLQVILDAEQNIQKHFPNWNAKKQCPHGIFGCPKLGNHSKQLLIAMHALFGNIADYEDRTGHDYFQDNDETDRLLIFLSKLVTRICEENIVYAAASKGAAPPDDKELIPYLKITHNLVALPTELHQIRASWKKNKDAIDKLLSILPLKEQRELYDYMRTLMLRAEDPSYAHKSGDASTHLLFAGPSGSGKTYVALKILELLDFPIMKITLDELREGQNVSYIDLDDLADEDEKLSGIETKMLRLKKDKKRGISSLNPVMFIDELDEDRNYTVSDLKDQLDQFKKLYLPSLGLTLPGFLYCMFTTNNTKLVKDPALMGRFVQVLFPEMPIKKKIEILFPALQAKVEHYPELKEKHDDLFFKNRVEKYVKFNPAINLRILMANIDSVIAHALTHIKVKQGDDFLVPTADRENKLETFKEFLERKFTGLDLGDDSDSDDD